MVLGTGGAPVAAKVPAPMPSLRPAAILTVISGSVAMRFGSSAFTAASDGAVIYVGSTIRTSADSRAVITLFEGSTVELEPASDITIEEATMRGDSTIVELAQSLGRSWHVVTHLTTPDSRYEVKTPAATASVRGTAFEIAVVDALSGPSTTVTTTEGLVATTDASGVRSVLVAADQTTTVHANSQPEPARSAPSAQRVVTVTTRSESSIVVDPLGRANGLRDGKVVAQTPGARVRSEGGTIVITLPDVPDGVFSTTVADGSVVSVSTTVTDAGREPVSLTTDAAAGSVGVEVRTTSGQPEVRALDDAETKRLRGDSRSVLETGPRPSAKPTRGANALSPERALTATPTKKLEGTARPPATPKRTASPSPNRR